MNERNFGEKPKHKWKLSERLKFQQMCSVHEKVKDQTEARKDHKKP